MNDKEFVEAEMGRAYYTGRFIWNKVKAKRILHPRLADKYTTLKHDLLGIANIYVYLRFIL